MSNFEEISEIIYTISTEDFINRYYIAEGVWYFEEYLQLNPREALETERHLKSKITKTLNLNEDSVFLVGSGKIGLSLNPDHLFRPFRINGEAREKASDIDIAVISEELYNDFWDLFRESFSPIYSRHYRYISREIYRGYINERNLMNIPLCRRTWSEKVNQLNKFYRMDYGLTHEVNYRIYRNKEDFLEYSAQNIEKIKLGE